METHDRTDERVLILAPAGRDAELLGLALAQASMPAHVCSSPTDDCYELYTGAGAIVLTEEALDEARLRELVRGIEAQPTWSDVPVIVLMSSRAPRQERTAIEGLDVLGNVTVLLRPVSGTVFVNAARSALRARRRQHEVRGNLRKLEDSNRAKDEFVAMLAHELRNPLGAMRFAMEVLGSGKANADSIERSHAVMDRQIRRLTRMLDDLLDASRFAQRKVQLKRAPVDLVRCAEDSVSSVQPLFSERRIELSSDLPRARVQVEADADRLVQVIDNLLTNSAKYTPAGGKTKVSVRKEDGEAVLSVSDSGIGIADEDLERVFEVFAQVTPPIDRSQGGLGLGLTIARGIAELHGGTLTAESDGRGHGTTFTLRLPITDGAGAKAPQPSAPRRHKSRRVLVAEDNDDARETLRVMLELQGHTVSGAADGIAAVEAAIAEKPQVGIIDIGLPGLDGYEVARKLRRRFGRELRLIALTGYGQPEARTIATSAGFDAFLVKPVDPDELARALEA